MKAFICTMYFFCILSSSILHAGNPEQAWNLEKQKNLTTCLSGRYPTLCNHSLLTPTEARQVAESERLHNLQTCLSGKYPTLCNHALLTDVEVKRVAEAERLNNLQICLTGRYPTLCNHSLLTPTEAQRVTEAERLYNLQTCLSGQYPSICNHSLLTSEESQRVAEAEQQVKSNKKNINPPSGASRSRKSYGRSDCESGHWIDSVSSNGSIIKLEDGSIWEVDSIDTIDSSLWLPITDIVVCDEKLINTDDGESVGATRLK